jgi:hypothetical protein
MTSCNVRGPDLVYEAAAWIVAIGVIHRPKT